MSQCKSCHHGAPADTQGRDYYCIARQKYRAPGESRGEFLRRVRVRARDECGDYQEREVGM